MEKYAVIRLNGSQYQLKPGDIIEINGTHGEVGKSVDLGEILIVRSDSIQIGTPTVDAKATFEVISHGRSKKIEIFKYKSKSRYRRRAGHRQDVTVLKLTSVADLKLQTKPKQKPTPAKTTNSTEATKKTQVAATKTISKSTKTKTSKTTKTSATKKPAPASPAKKVAPKKTTAKKAAK